MHRYRLHLWVAVITMFALMVVVGGMWRGFGAMVFLSMMPLFWMNQSRDSRLPPYWVFMFGMVAGMLFNSAVVGWNDYPSQWFASLDQRFLLIAVALAWCTLLSFGVKAFRRTG